MIRLYVDGDLHSGVWTSSLHGRHPALQWLYDACTIMPRQLKGLESLAISLGRVESAADLSWVEGILKTSTRGEGAHGHGREPQMPPGEVAGPGRIRDCEASESPPRGASHSSFEGKCGDTGEEFLQGRGAFDGTDEMTRNGSSDKVKGRVVCSNSPGSADSALEPSDPSDPCDPAVYEETLEAVPTAVDVTEGAGIPSSIAPAPATPSRKPPECPPTAGVTLTVDARMVPTCATLSVGVFILVCSDDRAGRNADGETAGGLGKLEISGGASGVATACKAEPFAAAAASNTGATKPEDPSSENQALFVSWETLTTTTEEERRPSAQESAGLGFAKAKLARFFRTCFARHSVRCLVPTGGRASVRLGEMQVQCRPAEASVAKDGSDRFQPSASRVVVRNFSVVPTVLAVTPEHKEETDVSLRWTESERLQRPRSFPPSRHVPASADGVTHEAENGDDDSRGDGGTRLERCPGGREDGAPAAVLRRRGLEEFHPSLQQFPPPLPPRASPPGDSPARRLQRSIVDFWRILRREPGQLRRESLPLVIDPPGLATFRVPDVNIHANTVTGGVDAGLAGWLNLRGLLEAEEMAATQNRIAQMIAAGKPTAGLFQTSFVFLSSVCLAFRFFGTRFCSVWRHVQCRRSIARFARSSYTR